VWRCAILLVVTVLAPIWAEAAVAEPDPILVVAFGPFAGRGENGSATVARALDGRTVAGHPVVTAVLPVAWGAPERKLPALVAEHRPRLVLGLGEGHPGRVAIETRAVNARAHRDERGQPPPSGTIEADGPDARASRFAIPDDLPATDVPVVRSDDAGRYLCNNLLWVTISHTEDRAGFIHLPPQGDQADAVYAPRFTPLIEAAIAAQFEKPAQP